MKKIKRFVAGVLCVAMVAALAACGGSDGSASDAQVKIGAKELGEQMAEADGGLPDMTTITSDDKDADLNFTSLCDFDYDKVDSYWYSYAADGSASEMSVVILKDSGDAAELMKSLKQHVQDREGTMANYSPDQVQLVDNYILKNEGKYVTLIISEHNGAAEQAFEDAIK